MNSRIRGFLKEPIIAILLLALIVRLIHYSFILDSLFILLSEIFRNSDMHASLSWAEKIINGDFLGVDTFHPFNDWMEMIAPMETWHRWWGGKEIFQQGPMYAYLLAAQIKFLGLNTAQIVLGQLLIGVLQCWVVYEIGKTVFGKRTGLIAGTIAAVYGPFVFFQGIILADSWHSLFDLSALLLFLLARKHQNFSRYLACGALCGLALLTKPTSQFVLLAFLAITLFDLRFTLRQRLLNCFCLGISCLIVLSPLFIRNYKVGAPITAISNRTGEAIVIANAKDGHPIMLKIPKSLGPILEKSQRDKKTLIWETIKTYNGDYKELFNRQLLKVRALLSPLEICTNSNFNYGKFISPILGILPNFACIFPLALLAMLLLIRRRPKELWILYSFLIAILPAILLSSFRGRYRLTFVTVLIILAAHAIALLWNYLENKKYRNFAMGMVAAILLSFFQKNVISPYSKDFYHFLADRPNEYFYSAEIYDMNNDSKRAIEMLDAAAIALKNRKDFSSIDKSIKRIQKDLLQKMIKEQSEGPVKKLP